MMQWLSFLCGAELIWTRNPVLVEFNRSDAKLKVIIDHTSLIQIEVKCQDAWASGLILPWGNGCDP